MKHLFLFFSLLLVTVTSNAQKTVEERLKDLEDRTEAAEGNLIRIKSEYDKKLKDSIKVISDSLDKMKQNLAQFQKNTQIDIDDRLKAFEDLYGLSKVPVGTILSYYGDPSKLPKNWRLCNGSVVDDDAQSPFFTKRLPDLTGRFLRGTQIYDAGSGLASYKLGDEGGIDFISRHDHTIDGYTNDVSFGIESLNGWQHAQSLVNGANLYIDEGEKLMYNEVFFALTIEDGTNNSHGHKGGSGTVSGSTSSTGSHDNRPKFYTVYYIIRIK